MITEIIHNPPQVKTITGWVDWGVYFIFTFMFLCPFFYGDWLKHVCLSLLISFFAGILNRIVRELVFIKNALHTTKKEIS